MREEVAMKKWLRRIRGAIKMGLTWGFVWFAAGMVLLLIVGPDAADVPFPLGFGFLGFLAGITFSAVLVSLEGRRRFDQMSLPRFAGWGAVGGMLFSVAFVFVVAAFAEGAEFIQNLVFLGPLFAAAGAGSASGMLILARKAEDRESLEATSEDIHVGLTDKESRELLETGG
jgi:hypothetical protein